MCRYQTADTRTTVSIGIADDDVNAEDDACGVQSTRQTDDQCSDSNDDHANGQAGADINFGDADGVDATDGATTYGTMDGADGTWECTLDDTMRMLLRLPKVGRSRSTVYDVVDGDGDTHGGR